MNLVDLNGEFILDSLDLQQMVTVIILRHPEHTVRSCRRLLN